MFKIGDEVTCIAQYTTSLGNKSYTIVHIEIDPYYPTRQWLQFKDHVNNGPMLTGHHATYSTIVFNGLNRIKCFMLTSEYLTNKNFNNTLNTLNKVLE